MDGSFNCHHIHTYVFLKSGNEEKAFKDFSYLIDDLRDTLKLLSSSGNYGNKGIQFNKRWKNDSYFHHVSKDFDDLNERALYLAKLDQEPHYTNKVLIFARHEKCHTTHMRDVVSLEVYTSPYDEIVYLDVHVKALHPENLPYLLTRITSKVKNAIQSHHNKLIYQTNLPEIEEYLKCLSESFLS